MHINFEHLFFLKAMVWLYWKSYLQSITHQRDPTTNQHENFWLLSFPSGPLRPSLGNLIFSDSSKKAMLMPTLVRTPIQHESIATRTPLLISFHYLTSQTQDYRSTPHSQPIKYYVYFNLSNISYGEYNGNIFIVIWSLQDGLGRGREQHLGGVQHVLS